MRKEGGKKRHSHRYLSITSTGAHYSPSPAVAGVNGRRRGLRPRGHPVSQGEERERDGEGREEVVMFLVLTIRLRNPAVHRP